MRRPRASVLDEVWRGLDGVEALSGPHGGPLRRTVKLILDPLVIRPVQHPVCAGAVLTADGATLLATRVHAAADVLRATAAWFTLLKQVRRALRITEGNAQDLYFQRCFELATEYGHPHPTRDRPRAEATASCRRRWRPSTPRPAARGGDPSRDPLVRGGPHHPGAQGPSVRCRGHRPAGRTRRDGVDAPPPTATAGPVPFRSAPRPADGGRRPHEPAPR
ncbi:hypothetical protein [Nocardia farcinica]|uniref:hypothetical protein n=1 Tax=Nocardia farcinica TaxID=37329 RepID=UPI003F685105